MRSVLVCLLVSFAISLAAEAADGDVQCGRLSTRTSSRANDEKTGDFMSHQAQIYLRSNDKDRAVLLMNFLSVGPPQVGCLRKSALMVAGGDPVEGRAVVLFFPDGRYEPLWWHTPLEFHDAQAILRGPISIFVYRDEDREKIPPEFRDLFHFIGDPK
jgi:hypothetical protein